MAGRSTSWGESIVRHTFVAAASVLACLACSTAGRAVQFETYITGDDGAGEVIFHVTLDPEVAFSAAAGVKATDTLRLDGIDFVPRTAGREVVVGAQTGAGAGAIQHWDMTAPATKLADYTLTPGGTRPSTILSTPKHAYFVPNQFGFEAGPDVIGRVPFAGGPPELVFDGSAAGAGGLVNFEGLEMVGGRLYFFTADPGAAGSRALHSIGLDAAGLWDGAAPTLHAGGLTAGPGGDGSDELDFDPYSGLIFGTNIVSGEVIAVTPGGGPVTSPGAAPGFFIDAAQVAGGDPLGLKLLEAPTPGLGIDGIRSDGLGHLVVVGLTGVIASIDIDGVMTDGADDADVIPLYVSSIAGTGFSFDDFTPLSIPEPATAVLLATGLLVALFRRRPR